MTATTDPTEPVAPEVQRQKLHQQVMELVQGAIAGDPATLPSLRTLLRNPLTAGLVEEFGNLAAAVEEALVAAYCGPNLLRGEALRLKLERLRAELAGPEPAPLERLLVERVVLCWLQLHVAGVCAGRNPTASIVQCDFYERQQTRAQARYLAAIKALVTVRKLLRPALSPLELAARPVDETAGLGAGRANPRRCGEPCLPN